MDPDRRKEEAAALLDRFARATGLASSAPERRYLWTDAFAVITWAGLGTPGSADLAEGLVDRVHRTLARHRPDDPRSGWISGLAEEEGESRPTAGGLRIGKPRPERPPGEQNDPGLEWERDGQYFHYLTKWMRALVRLRTRTGNVRYGAWATELADVAFRAFAHGAGDTPGGLYWKMSIDLTRPLVPTMGQHDALDGYVAFFELREGAAEGPSAGVLGPAMKALAAMSPAGGWATGDPLGAGSLLTDAWLLAAASASTDRGETTALHGQVLERVLAAVPPSLAAVSGSGALDLPASRRLAFRELGLSLGLSAAERLVAVSRSGEGGVAGVDGSTIRGLAEAVPLRERIEAFWLDPANREASTWQEHEDINTVMLAASLAPEGYLDRG